MKSIVHVNQHTIKQNQKYDARDPVLSIKEGARRNTYAHEAIIHDRDGDEVARVVYSPDKPLKCGARVWIETDNDITPIIHEGETDGETA